MDGEHFNKDVISVSFNACSIEHVQEVHVYIRTRSRYAYIAAIASRFTNRLSRTKGDERKEELNTIVRRRAPDFDVRALSS